MSQRVNVNIHPHDGYFFKDADGTTIRAPNNWQGVIARVVAYRRRNKLAPGDPINEVHAQACSRNPSACHDNADPTTMRAIKSATLKGRVLKWLASLRGKPLLWGDEENMRARAAVCAGCPAHASIGGGCGACKKAVAEVRKDLLAGRPVDERLSGCLVLNEDCAISCWIDQPLSDNPELPGCCWRRRTPP